MQALSNTFCDGFERACRLEEVLTVLTAETVSVGDPIADTNLLNLLIVDDERSVRESCREVAMALGFSTHIADSPEQCYRD